MTETILNIHSYAPNSYGHMLASKLGGQPALLPPHNTPIGEIYALRLSDKGISRRPLLNSQSAQAAEISTWGDFLQSPINPGVNTQRIINQFVHGPAVNAARVLMLNVQRARKALDPLSNHPILSLITSRNMHYDPNYQPQYMLGPEDQVKLLHEINFQIDKLHNFLPVQRDGLRLACGLPHTTHHSGESAALIPPYPQSNRAIESGLQRMYPEFAQRNSLRASVTTERNSHFLLLGRALLWSSVVRKQMPFDRQSNGGRILAIVGRDVFGACLAEVERRYDMFDLSKDVQGDRLSPLKIGEHCMPINIADFLMSPPYSYPEMRSEDYFKAVHRFLEDARAARLRVFKRNGLG